MIPFILQYRSKLLQSQGVASGEQVSKILCLNRNVRMPSLEPFMDSAGGDGISGFLENYGNIDNSYSACFVHIGNSYSHRSLSSNH